MSSVIIHRFPDTLGLSEPRDSHIPQRDSCKAHPSVKLSGCSTDLNDPATLQRLLDCLLYALAIDDQIELAESLGLSDVLSNREALGIWVTQETQGIGFLDAGALFNYVLKQLDNLTAHSRRSI